jgi:hypothetical protein
VTVISDKWKKAFELIQNAEQASDSSSFSSAEMSIALGALHLVQPFNWNQWPEPVPSREDVEDLSLLQCIKQVTRIVRADRTNEGVLWGAAHTGLLSGLCTTAQRLSAGQRIPSLQELGHSQ